MKTRVILVSFLLALFALGGVPVPDAQAAGHQDVQFFYSETCPHCLAEYVFLDAMQDKYPSLTIARYPIKEKAVQERLRELLEPMDAMEYFGVVPITFVGTEMFVGFDDSQGIGADIEASVVRLLSAPRADIPDETAGSMPQSSIIDRYHLDGLPLPVVAITLGLLDGFNVCSLGALALILGLVLVVRDRKRIVLLGGTFILTTAIVYGILITLWYRLFAIIGGAIGILQALVGLAAAGAGAYFLVQFWRFRVHGPTCGFSGGRFVQSATMRVQKVLGGGSGILAGIAAVLVFAAVITAVEFPCSAAVPLVFAGMLADSGAGVLASLGLIALFVLLYLLDELIVFGIAVSRLRLWLSSPTITTWALLVEGILLLGIGLWYILGIIR